MIKKAYEQPAMKIVEIQQQSHILAGSLTSIQIKGLDNGESLIFDDDNKSDNTWNDAW
ncbi:MAG: hypothetical protein IJ552_01025 [Prevotella sp.]|nr:hypothetical protein [Prevotella sp.]